MSTGRPGPAARARRPPASAAADGSALGTDHLYLVAVRIVDVEGAHAREDRVLAAAHLQPGGAAAALEVVVAGPADVEGQVVQRPKGLLSGKATGGLWVRHEHDHLGHRALARACSQEAVWQLGRRDHLEAEEVAVEGERTIHVVCPQHDLSQVEHRPAHAAAASIISARFDSLARGGTEQPGARSSP